MSESTVDEHAPNVGRGRRNGNIPLSSLSAEEQLARKRARDRKSQRAMRDRANWTIHSLQEQVTQLTEMLATERNETIELKKKLQVVEGERDHLRSETASLQLQILARDELPQSPNTTQPHEAVPLNVLPTCLADQILQRFIESRRLSSMSFEALDQSEAAEGLNINYLLDPNPYQRADTISHIATDIVKTYTEIDTLPKQVAILYIINKLLTVSFLFIPERYLASDKVSYQWLIMRGEDSYNNMPAWLRPKTIQIQIPHPAWIDRIPW